MPSAAPPTVDRTRAGLEPRRVDRPWPVLLLYGPLVLSIAAALASAFTDGSGRLPTPPHADAAGEAPPEDATTERLSALLTDARVPRRLGPSSRGPATHDPPGR